MKAKHIISSVFVLLLCISLTACEKSEETAVTEISDIVEEIVIDEPHVVTDDEMTADDIDYVAHHTFDRTEAVEIFLDNSESNNIIFPDTVSDGKQIVSIAGSSVKDVAKIEFPKPLLNIGSYAFENCTLLEEISMKKRTYYINEGAFRNCTALKEINTEYSFAPFEIDNEAFRGCTSLERTDLPARNFGDYVFADCTSLKSAYVTNNTGKGHFSGCTALEEVSFRTSTKIISSLTFENCISLKEISLPISIDGIGSGVFKNCTSLETVKFAIMPEYFGESVFEGCTSLKTVYLSDDWSHDAVDLFKDCTALEKVIYQENEYAAEEFLKGTIYGREKYNKRIVVDTDSALEWWGTGHEAYYHCDDGLEFRSKAFSWGIKGYDGKEQEYVLPAKINSMEVTHIGRDFSGAEMKTLYIPDTVTKIDGGAFANCRNLENIFISDKNKNFIITDNLVLSADGKRVISYYGNKSEVIIPDGVTEIDRQAFMFTDITSVKLPEGLEIIGDEAFRLCSVLSSVQFPDTLTLISEDAFEGCRELTEISLKSDGILKIYEGAFWGCSNVKKITLENIDLICERAFNCDNAEEITINGSLGQLEFNAFTRGFSSESAAVVTLPDDFGGFKRSESKFSVVPYIYKGKEMSESTIAAVMAAPELAEDFDIKMNELGKIVIVSYKGSDTVVNLRKYKTEVPITELSYSVFKDNDKITSVILCDSVLTIDNRAFEGCSSLESVTLSKELRSVDFRQFETCEKLEEIIIPEENNNYVYKDGMFFSKNLKTLYYVMEDYTEFTIPESVENIDSDAFCGLLNLKKLVVTKSVKELPNGIFTFYYNYYDPENYYYPEELPVEEIVIEGNTYMGNDIYVPDSCKKITVSEENEYYTVVDDVLFSKDMKTLYWCPDTKTEYIVPDGVEYIGDRAFWGNEKLKNITFPDSLVNIGSSVFGWTSLEQVIFPEKLRDIEAYAFYNCKTLSKVEFNENLEVIGFGAFYNCPLTGVVTIPDSVEYVTMIFLGDPDSGAEFIIPEYSFSYRGNTYTAEEIMEHEGFGRYGCD